MKQIILFVAISLLMFVKAFADTDRTERLYLSGVDAGHPKTWLFCCSGGMNSGKWKKIKVPCSWELQGFGNYTYGRFYKTKGLKASDETGRYKTTFSVPKSWQGKLMRLTFEGCMTDTQVWIDGHKVNTLLLDGRNTGMSVHQGGFMTFSYDVTPFIVPGKKQTIEVLVSKESANKSINSAERRADWWLFGGIYRPVYIEAVPQEHIDHLSVDAKADGRIFVNSNAKYQLLSLSIEGNDVPYDEAQGCYYFANPRKWDPEHPNLYNATFTLHNSKGDAVHRISQKIGFRTIEFRENDGIYLNGTRLIVKGTNRHCFWPETGRAVSNEQSKMDAMLIKSMNMNAVRCHYPSDQYFMDMCDSLGLLYLAELPGWQTHYDDTTAVRLMLEFIPQCENHPCVFLWSNGNEGGWNTCVDSLFAKLDIQKRKVVHPWSDFEGIDTHHYPAYQTGTYRMQNGQNVFMPTEFLHSKYDKGGGSALDDMWSHWMRSPLFAGGFIWAYVDEAVRRRDLGNILDSDGGNGPDGCMDPYRQPEASYYTIREIWSPVYIDRLNVNPSFDGRVLVSNHYLFSNLSECSMRFTIKNAKGYKIKDGWVELPSLSPGESGYAQFTLPDNFFDNDILELTAYNSNDTEICTWTAPIKRADQQIISGKSDIKITFDDNGNIKVGDLEGPLPVGMLATCYKHTNHTEADGTIVNTFYYKGGIDSIQWRQTPDGLLHMDAVVLNDEKGHGYQGAFLTDESKWQLGLSFRYPELNVDSVCWMGRGPYRVWRNRLKGQQFGIWGLAYNNTVTGQYNSVNPPVYPEFKGYRSDLRWVEFYKKNADTKNIRPATSNHTPAIKIYSKTEGLYLRLFTPEEAVDQTPGEMGGIKEGKTPKKERTMIPFPDGDISFLLSIPPMQSYKPLEQLGPQSQPDNIRIKAGDEGFHIKLVFEFT